MIFITGDVHGDFNRRFANRIFAKAACCELQELSKEDYVIVCGDFGIWDNSREENYWLDWMDQKPYTTLFVSGNHENYDILDGLPVQEWHGGQVNFVRDSVIHLRRGQVFEIAGKKVFAFGGAGSHDISDGILEPDDPMLKRKKIRIERTAKLHTRTPQYRINHVSWWARELPSEEEMEEGICSLERNGNSVDYIITHCPWTDLLRQLDRGEGKYPPDRLTDYLQRIHDTVQYDQWYFGHLHREAVIGEERAVCLNERILKVSEPDVQLL